jgi:hypothetical protein
LDVARVFRRLALLPVAILLSAVVATDAMALTWTADRLLTNSGGGYAYRGGLAVSSSTIAHAIYEQYTLGSFTVFYRRSTNSGSTWATPIPLSRGDVGEAGVPSIDAYSSAVDAVWVEGDDIFKGLDSVVMYRRSTDSGATWKSAIQISTTLGRAGFPRVVHGSSGHVLVTWTDQVTGKIYARLSTNSGSSFGSTMYIASTTNHPLSNAALYDGYPSAASVSGVFYLVYDSTAKAVRMRRSTDGGAHWGSPVTITSSSTGEAPTVATVGSTVLVGYGLLGNDIYAAARRSTDKGVHWSSPIAIALSSQSYSFAPVITYRSGAFRAVWEQCDSNNCSLSKTYYSASSSGATWSKPISASSRKQRWDYPGDVDVATKVLVLYSDVGTSSGDVHVRQGS